MLEGRNEQKKILVFPVLKHMIILTPQSSNVIIIMTEREKITVEVRQPLTHSFVFVDRTFTSLSRLP